LYRDSPRKLCLIETSVGKVFIIGAAGLRKTDFATDKSNKHRNRYFNKQFNIRMIKGRSCILCKYFLCNCPTCMRRTSSPAFTPAIKVKKHIMRKWRK